MIQQLEELVAEAKKLLESNAGCHTNADKAALTDMITRAQKALAGEDVAFSRNREFLKPRENEAVQFAYHRYTMAPTFFDGKKVYGYYGLKEAVEWFKEQDMNQWSQKMLEQRKQEIVEKGTLFLNNAAYGENIGEYDSCCGESLREKLEVLKTANAENLALSLVQCMDALQEFRFSRKLYSEKEAKPVFLLTKDKIEELQKEIQKESLVAQQYADIKKIAQETSLDESRMVYEQIWNKYSYEELNAKFHIWGDTGRVVNMMTPEGTMGARISFCLPREENEEQGLGHIWIKDVLLSSADGSEISVSNEQFVVKSGGTIEFSSMEDSIYLCNPTASDEVIIEYKDIIPLKENSGYTLFFKAKQDGKFKTGLRASVEFLDAEDEVIEEFVHIFNRKSSIAVGRKALTAQCNAICYALEQDMECAQKAKYDILTFLNDFCQGAENWMVYNERPEGCDAYGAVQAGRIMCTIASAYSLISDAEVFSDEEKKFFYQMVDYLLQYCIDMRDRMSMTMERVQEGSSNWQTDMCIGVVSLMMVLPNYPNRKTWMYNAETVLEAQLTVNLNADGSWPESIRYHHAALEHFATFAAAWKQETGEDWLVTTRLKDMFAYTIHTITPPYEYFDGKIGTPPFGDHRLSGGNEFGIYGLYIDLIREVDKKLADEMFQVWQMSKCPIKGFSSEALAIENLLYIEPTGYKADESNKLQLTSTAAYPDSGIYVFRHCDKEQKENYLAVMGAQKPIGHGHLDVGTFVLYYHNYPVIMDSGIEGYFDASTQWHLCSYSHACLQFAATEEDRKAKQKSSGAINLSAGNYSLDRGWLDVPRTCKVLEVVTGEAEEQITLEIEHPQGREKGVHCRKIIFNKISGEVIVKDSIKNYAGKVLFSMPMVMKTARIDKNVIHAEGHYPVNMDVEFVTSVESIVLELGRTTPMFPTTEEIPMLVYVRACMDAAQEIEVHIRPFEQ